MTKTDSNMRKSYKLYKTIASVIVDIKLYIIIACEYNKFLIEKLLTGDEITLPGRMGTLMIVGHKDKIKFREDGSVNLPPDWVKTKQLWNNNPEAKEQKKLIYHMNEKTNGVRYKILWSKSNVAIENKTIYSLRMTRTNKRESNASIEQGVEYLIKI